MMAQLAGNYELILQLNLARIEVGFWSNCCMVKSCASLSWRSLCLNLSIQYLLKSCLDAFIHMYHLRLLLKTLQHTQNKKYRSPQVILPYTVNSTYVCVYQMYFFTYRAHVLQRKEHIIRWQVDDDSNFPDTFN